MSSYQSYLYDSVKDISGSLTYTMSELIEFRDSNTGSHVIRTSKYMDAVARELKSRGLFERELSDTAIDLMTRAAPLHDVGKIAITDRILLTPGRLDDDEFEIMKTHAAKGAEILKEMYARTPALTYLMYASMVAASHHERFDGRGYPYGLAGSDIPLCGRIMSVADVYDALVDDRVYRKGVSHDEAVEIIAKGRGNQFDPDVADAFLSRSRVIEEIARTEKKKTLLS
jgi:putative two-component system response regulator